MLESYMNENADEMTCDTQDGEQSCGVRIQDQNFQIRYTEEGDACATYPEDGKCRSVSWNFIEEENKACKFNKVHTIITWFPITINFTEHPFVE